MTVSKFAPIGETDSPAPFYRAVGDEVEIFRAAARRGSPVLLKGPTGCGKTRFVEAMAHELGRVLITVAGHEDMTSADLVGRFLLKGGETVWVDGPLTRAVRDGAIFYLDEVVEARQDTTVVIHPLADHRRELPVDRLGTTLSAAPGFQLVVSYNPGYQSVLKNLKESTRQRFIAIELGFPPAEIETEVVAREAGVDADTARALVQLGSAIRNLDGSPLREVSSTRMLVLAGGLVAEGLNLRSAVQSAVVQVLSDDADVVRALGELVDAVLPQTVSPSQFRLVASFIAGRSLDIAEAPAGQSAHTNGQVVLVSADAPVEQQRREVLVQSALLGAGSLDVRLLKGVRGRPSVARRYLALEGRRVLRDLADRLPGTDLNPDAQPATATADESLDLARTRRNIADAPPWFGVLRPSLLLASPGDTGSPAKDNDMRLEFAVVGPPDDDEDNEDDEDDDPTQRSRILKIFETPVVTTDAVANFLRKILGGSRSEGSDTAGSEMRIGSVRRTQSAGLNARPLPTQIRFTDDGKPGAAVGIGGALHPEWDVFANRYRPDWCRVIEFPLTSAADVNSAGVTHDDVLRRRLSRIGLGPKVLRARPDGDELDIAALIDLFVDLRSGYSPPEHVYAERRKLARNLGVLILLDASGSATDTDSEGLAVHEHQRQAAATLAVTLEELGDRVAVYAFRSHGRHAVHLPAIKTFDQRFGAGARARLSQLQPSGYTRLGAGIRGSGEVLKSEAGTPNRLLLVLSDGFPYDEGYEGHYAEADAYKALEELRVDGVACLCLSIGGSTETDVLERVFGSTSFASAPVLADLSPHMDELFMSALAELAVPR